MIRIRTILALGSCLTALSCLSGCSLFAYIAVAREAALEQTMVDHDAEYTGLDGKTFALIVTADRTLLAEFPYVVQRMTVEMNERLRASTMASGYVPPLDLLNYTYNNPRWVARPLGEVAQDIGVDRLVIVELRDYRLYEMGNQYLWDGYIFATVGVIEAESLAPDEFVFSKTVRVRFPDEDSNYTTDDPSMTQEMVQQVLESRFINRVTWLFYKHEEKYRMEY